VNTAALAIAPAPAPTVEEIEERRRCARHEAAHAVAWIVFGLRDFEVTLNPNNSERAEGVAAIVRTKGKATPREPTHKPPRGALLARILREVGTIYYSGVAAESPRSVGFPIAALTTSSSDRAALVRIARVFERSRPPLDYTAWRRACRFVDENWGAIQAVAAALLDADTLTGAQVLEIASNAPRERNEWRPPWR
jgi:hypothetical protein